MTSKAGFAALVRAEVGGGLTPTMAFAKVRREHPELFVSLLTANGKMSRSQAQAFIAERENHGKR